MEKREQKSEIGNPAKLGYDWFIQASIDSPASNYGQAARILELAREAGYDNPVSFGDALRRNDDLITAIKSAALNKHSGVKGAPKSSHQLNSDLIKGVIKLDFDKAAELMILRTDQLSYIWRDIVPRHSDVEDTERREDIIRVDVSEMISKAHREVRAA